MTNWLRLFYRLLLRPLLADRSRTLLTLFIIGLGVSVVVAIDSAGTAATGSFRSTLEDLTGQWDLDAGRVGGLDERILAKVVALPYALRFQPRIDDYAYLRPSGEVAPLLGLDLVAESLTAEYGDPKRFTLESKAGVPVWVGNHWRSYVGRSMAVTVAGRPVTFFVKGELKIGSTADNPLIVMDIGLAQKVCRKEGRLDGLNLRLPASMSVADGERMLRTALPDDVLISPQGARTAENHKMLAAFRWNLRVLSLISLVVGAFLIYNTVSISVVRRRNEIGVLRALGVPREGILFSLLAEAAVLGLAGSAAGILLGRLLAEFAVRMLAATVSLLYVTTHAEPVRLTLPLVMAAVVLGTGVALLSALLPALEAASVAPVEAMARGRAEYLVRVQLRWQLMAAAIFALLGYWATLQPPWRAMPLFGYVASVIWIGAAALLIPSLITAWTRLAAPSLWRLGGVESALASRSLEASLRRSAVLAAALATAIAMITSVGIMVGSFRQTVVVWMERQLQADFFLRSGGPSSPDQFTTIPASLADAAERIPGVVAVDRFRLYPIRFEGLPANLGGAETRTGHVFRKLALLDGRPMEPVLELLHEGDNVLVSEPFANKHNLHTGDVIRLPLGAAERPFRVQGVYFDYSSERGYVIMDRDRMSQYLPDQDPTNAAVYVADGSDRLAIRQALDRLAAPLGVNVTANRSLRQEAIKLFDQTFAITYSLEAVAVVVAVLGVAGALLAMVIDRRRELGLLRFLGASQGQIRKLILMEAALLGLFANVIGVGLGYALSMVLIHVINKQSFGWTIQFHWPVGILLTGLTGVYIATILAALYPARVAMDLNPIEVVHEE